jgi:hypothetical protein
VGKGPFVGPIEAKRREDGGDFSFRLDDSDRPQEARAKRTAQGVGAQTCWISTRQAARRRRGRAGGAWVSPAAAPAVRWRSPRDLLLYQP